MKEGLTMKNEWNLASEILPDDNSRVLVYTEHNMYGAVKYTKRDITIGRYDNEAGKWKCESFLGNRVIAWMRFPEFKLEV